MEAKNMKKAISLAIVGMFLLGGIGTKISCEQIQRECIPLEPKEETPTVSPSILFP